eukprot:7861657-Prorocentrum_lima.AAC.1
MGDFLVGALSDSGATRSSISERFLLRLWDSSSSSGFGGGADRSNKCRCHNTYSTSDANKET